MNINKNEFKWGFMHINENKKNKWMYLWDFKKINQFMKIDELQLLQNKNWNISF